MKNLPDEARVLIDRLIERTHDDATADVLAEVMERQPAAERNALLLYWDIRLAGESALLAEMLALQAPPMSNTDREFLEGHCNGNQFGKGPLANDLGNRLRSTAEAGGQSVKGKVYMGGLARYPGDPRAWVSGRGDVKKVVEERGWTCSGSVESKPDSRRDAAVLAAQEAPILPTGGLSVDE